MNYKQILTAFIFISTLLCACDKLKKDGDMTVQSAEVDDSALTDIPGDSLKATLEWGEPAPPPQVNGDGSSLFEERINPQAQPNQDEEDVADFYAWSFGRKRDPLAEAALRNSVGQHPDYGYNKNPIPEKKVWKPANTGNDMNFDFDNIQYNQPANSKVETLPYAANEQEKIQFLSEFYKNFMEKGGKNVDTEQLSITCQRMLTDLAKDKEIENIADFFRTNPKDATNSTEQTAANIKVSSSKGDWFDVTMDEGHGEKTIRVKVVEVNRTLKVDEVDNKCW